MVFNATLNIISAIIMAVSFIGGGHRNTRRKPPTTCRKSLPNFITLMLYTSRELDSTTLVLIGTDCMGSYKSNYLIITITTALYINGQNCEHCVNAPNYEYIILSISKTLITSKSFVFDRTILASKNRVRTCKILGGEQIDAGGNPR